MGLEGVKIGTFYYFVTLVNLRRHVVGLGDCTLFMVALCNRETIYIFMLFLLLFFSSPNLSGRRLDVYHTLAHGVALVRI